MKAKEVKVGTKREFKLTLEDDNAIGEVELLVMVSRRRLLS